MLFIVFSPLFLVFLIRLHLSLIHWVDYFFSSFRSFVCSFVHLLMTNSFRAHSSVPSIGRWHTTAHDSHSNKMACIGMDWNKQIKFSMCLLICSVSAFASYTHFCWATNYRMHMLSSWMPLDSFALMLQFLCVPNLVKWFFDCIMRNMSHRKRFIWIIKHLIQMLYGLFNGQYTHTQKNR